MAVQAHIYPGWRKKWLFMVLFVFAFGGWFGYDGLIAYPKKNQKVAAFNYYMNQEVGEAYDDAGDPVGWSFEPLDEAELKSFKNYESYAAAKGWSTESPGKHKTTLDINVQFGFAIGCCVLAVVLLGVVLWHHGRTLEADDRGLTGATGKFVPYEAITSIDRRRWEKKGIAYVHYEHEGDKGRIKVDDYVFENGDKVLAEVEARTGLTEPAMV